MKKLFFIGISIFCCSFIYAQNLTQTIRGSVVDKETQSPIEFASIYILKDSTLIKSTTADENGQFCERKKT
jgi:hypothetical protein